MQPKKLTLTNFGPFIHETVDFHDFQEAGLFLISGKTGAGKTTIFDGMTFALFGETSGQMRSGKEMRSMFATPEEETLVTFTFEHQGLFYEIARSPEQELKKKRGEGTRKQTAKVSLTIYDAQMQEQKQYTKRTEVDQFIKDLLHLDAKQFFQIILLPQGEFRNFLVASSNDKEKLLRHLFSTELYQRLNEWLRQKQKTMTEALSQQQHRMEALVERFRWQEEARPGLALQETLQGWQKDLAYLQSEQALAQEALTAVKVLEKETEQALYAGKELLKKREEYQQLQAKKQEIEERSSEIEAMQNLLDRLIWVEKQASLLSNLDQYRKEHQTAEEAATIVQNQLQQNEQAQLEWQAQAATIEEQRKQVQDQQKSLQRLEDLLPYAQEVQKLQKEQSTHQEVLKKLEQELIELQQTLQRIETEETTCQEQLKAAEDLQQSEIRLIQSEHLVEGWQRLKQAVEMSQKAEEQVKNEQTSLQKERTVAEEACLALKETFEERQSENAKMQIARLRLLLKDGEPCPVCGSKEHAQENTHQTYSTEEIAQSERELEAAEANFREQREQLQQLIMRQEQLEHQQKNLKEQLAEEQQTLEQQTKQCEESLETTFFEQSPVELLKDHQARLQKEKSRQTEVQARLEMIHLQKNELAQQQQTLEKEKQKKQATCQQLSTKISTLMEQLQQRSYEELQLEQEKLSKEIHQVTATIQIYDEQGETLKLTQTRLTADQEHWKQQLSGLTAKVLEYQQKIQEQIAASTYDFSEESLRQELTKVGEAQELKRSLDNYGQERRFVSQRLEELAEVAQQKAPDLAQLQAEHQQAEAQAEELQQQVIQQQELYRNNQELLVQLTQLAEQNSVQLEEMSQLQQLFQTMNGDNQQKISIERYVLQSFLAEILEVANQRLIKLTRGRYQFLLAEEKGSYRSSTGLEINIYDDNAGMSRRAHTLSGGESFIAALALALSLADVIQNRSGGIAIEALFIDEGFGSLDEESLEMAMEALEMIENEGRLIGIISHVRELKDRIQQQLVVQANGNGQSRIKSQLM